MKYLEKQKVLPKPTKDAFYRIHYFRNPARHSGVQLNHKLVERAIAITEYVIRSEIEARTRDKKSEPEKESVPEGGYFKLPKLRTKIIPRNQMSKWVSQGWYERRGMGKNVEITREPYRKWQIFEIKIRYLLLHLGFEDCIEDIEDFNYTRLGPQVDACGGIDGIFFVIDCTSRKELGPSSIKVKIKNLAAEKERISSKIEALYPQKYHTKIFIVCTEDIEVSERDKEEAEERGIKLLDSDQVNKWFKYYPMLGLSLKYHIMKSLTGFSPVIVDDKQDPFFHYPAFQYKHGEKVAYHLLMDPETLLRLAYVYRLEMSDPKGYQRDLKRKKILDINDFLSDHSNYFPNNLIICFDSLSNIEDWPDFEPHMKDGNNGPAFGTLHIPKLYCSAEVIDGQHRLYGYLDSSEDQKFKEILRERRKADRLGIVAVVDPEEHDRPRLFVDINSNQTKVDPRQLWTLMSRIREDTLMGFIALLVEALNDGQVFRNKIHIPGVNSPSGKKLNIANLGKGLMDRKLLHKKEPWNLYEGDRNTDRYLRDELRAPLNKLEAFFRPLAKDKFLSKFVLSNNGANVMLRILVEKLKFEFKRERKLRSSEFRKYILKPTKKVLTDYDIKSLLKRTSNEAGRAEIAREIMKEIRKNRRMIGFAAEIFGK
jgi:DGQHR domain-containing protein